MTRLCLFGRLQKYLGGDYIDAATQTGLAKPNGTHVATQTLEAMGAAESVTNLCGMDGRCGTTPRNAVQNGDTHNYMKAADGGVSDGGPVATSDPEEESKVLGVVRSWLKLRENANAEGAAELSTADIMVRTPLGAISGLERGEVTVSRTLWPLERSGDGSGRDAWRPHGM